MKFRKVHLGSFRNRSISNHSFQTIFMIWTNSFKIFILFGMSFNPSINTFITQYAHLQDVLTHAQFDYYKLFQLQLLYQLLYRPKIHLLYGFLVLVMRMQLHSHLSISCTLGFLYAILCMIGLGNLSNLVLESKLLNHIENFFC